MEEGGGGVGGLVVGERGGRGGAMRMDVTGGMGEEEERKVRVRRWVWVGLLIDGWLACVLDNEENRE